MEDVENKIEGVVKQAYETKQELGKVDEKLEKNSMSSITTLTIFSAVILAFTGSITFTSGVFSGMSEVSPYRIVFLTSMIGSIVFNLIFMLLFVVGKMASKNIYCQCYYCDETLDVDEIQPVCGKGVCKKKQQIPNFVCILIHKYPYILFVNVLIFLIMYYDLVLFFINHVEYISFIKITPTFVCFLWALPVIVIFLMYTICLIKKFILYKRTVLAISLSIVERQFMNNDENTIANALTSVAASISRLFLSTPDRKKEIDEIIENIPQNKSERIRTKYVKKELKKISRRKLIQGEENLMNVSFLEHIDNKSNLREVVRKILDNKSEKLGQSKK